MRSIHWKAVSVAVALIATSSAASSALAASGSVSGTLFFRQAQGNFCPTGQNCNGAIYLQAEFNQLVGIPEVKVQVMSSAGAVIGSGATNTSGQYLVQWTTAGSLTNAWIRMIIDHKDGRFLIRTAADAQFIYTVANGLTLINGGTYNDGGRYWGEIGAPERITNVYHGAFRTWVYALAGSNSLASQFNNVHVLTDHPGCSSSCADGPTNTIKLDAQAPYAPQGRIMHEIGHLAHYYAYQHTQGILSNKGYYCWPNTTGDCTWLLNQSEWGLASFEEGFATFVGDLGLYNYTAPQPHTCLASVGAGGGAACPLNAFNTETSAGEGQPACGARTPIEVVRYLWDVYDDIADSATSVTSIECGLGGVTWTDTVGRDLWEFVDTMGNYVKGINDRQHDEPFLDVARTDYDLRDGRSNLDLNWNFRNRGVPANLDTNGPLCMNCGRPPL